MKRVTWDELEWGDHLRFGDAGRLDLDTALTYTVVDLDPGPRRSATLRAYRAPDLEPVFVHLTPRMLSAHQVTRVHPWETLAHELPRTFNIMDADGPAWLPRALQVSAPATDEADFQTVGMIGPQGDAAFRLPGELLTHWTLRGVAAVSGWRLITAEGEGMTTVRLYVPGSSGEMEVEAFGESMGESDTLILARAVSLACELEGGEDR